MRHPSASQGPLAPGTPRTHVRRESSGEVNNGPNASNRGGFPQGGRGRNYNPTYQQQPLSYTQGAPPFRSAPSQGRGNMVPPFQSQNRPMGQYPNSPHQAARTPALTNSMPGT